LEAENRGPEENHHFSGQELAGQGKELTLINFKKRIEGEGFYEDLRKGGEGLRA